MNHLEIILPIVILLLAFILKLSIDRSVDVPNLIQALCELPVDIIFLSVSFLVASIITKSPNSNDGLFFCFVFIVMAAIVVIIWRKSLKLYERGKALWVFLLLLNMLISTGTIFQSINVLLNKTSNKEITNTKNNGSK
ncbi:hypothetical protein [Elizabethkingia anophelis]|uniref:hypothetical protein n=1 Tax=Elizabethkingia anophelis TaxID=1117645 RepID=UPI003892AA4B